MSKLHYQLLALLILNIQYNRLMDSQISNPLLISECLKEVWFTNIFDLVNMFVAKFSEGWLHIFIVFFSNT